MKKWQCYSNKTNNSNVFFFFQQTKKKLNLFCWLSLNIFQSYWEERRLIKDICKQYVGQPWKQRNKYQISYPAQKGNREMGGKKYFIQNLSIKKQVSAVLEYNGRLFKKYTFCPDWLDLFLILTPGTKKMRESFHLISSKIVQNDTNQFDLTISKLLKVSSQARKIR